MVMLVRSPSKSLRCCIVKTDDNLSKRSRAKVKPVDLNITVSIVEDDAPLRGILGDWIRGAEGFQCVGVHENAEVALAALPQEKPSVVLMDINMPGMNGIEAARALIRRDPELPVVMLSIHEEERYRREAADSGVRAYIPKRRLQEQLLPALRDVLDGAARGAEERR